MAQSKEMKEKPDTKASAKPRVYALAAELDLDTKSILDLCRELGFTSITSQLKVLDSEQVAAIRDRVKHGPKAAASSSPARTPTPAKPVAPPKLETKVPTLTKAKPTPKTVAHPDAPEPAAQADETPVEPVREEAPIAEVTPAPQAAALLEPRVEVPATPAPIAEPTPEPELPQPSISTPAPVVSPPVFTPPTRVPNLNRPQNLGNRPPVTRPQPQPPQPTKAVAPTTPSAAPAHTPAPSKVTPPTPSTPAPAATPTPAATAAPTPTPAATPKPAAPEHHAPTPLPPRTGHTPPMPRVGGGMPNLNNPRSTNPSQGGANRPVPPSGGGQNPGRPGPGAGPGSGQRTIPGGMPPRHGATGGQPGAGRPGNYGPGANRPNPGAPSAPRTPQQGAASAPGAPKSVKLTPDQIQRMRELERKRGVKTNIHEIHRDLAPPTERDPAQVPPGGTPAPGTRGPGVPNRSGAGTPRTDESEGRGDGKGAPGKGRVGEVTGRDSRHKARQDKGRGRGGSTDKGAIIIGAGGTVDMIESQFGSRIKKHRGRAHVKPVTKVIGGKIEIQLPITVRSLSETIGMKSGELLLKLKNLTNSLYTINSNIEFEVAEMIAIEKGVELIAKRAETAEAKVIRELEEAATKSDSTNMQERPPIVTIMGHVDHGKTSLLDKIRQTYGHTSDVVSTETGGITQVLRAWQVEKDGKSTTFLDTPGHEAFTKMRARGANVTDIAVIVVSAADGIMPQTEEAVAHAKAAGVDIIVAINKIDLPGANPEKVKNQLYNLELVPDDMGGDVPVVLTSAVTGQGIGDLLDAIALLCEFAEDKLTADPTLAASGTCLEAYMEGERGVVATMLIQNGSLRKGDVLICGATYGRVRAMYNDLGLPCEEAGPSAPVKVIGLSDVPDADDPFYVIPDLSTAREIAEKRGQAKQEAALSKFSPVNLARLTEQNSKAKISELKIILKAEARGSVEAIRKELEKLVHEEVRTRVLHSGIGAITESDVTLALTSPEDTLILGFNVTADDAALALAEARNINIREYQIIYNLVDDVKAALEGRLKPIEEVVHLGRAVIRQTFKVGKVGTIAGCYVTSGVIERSSKVRIIREGAVIYPPPDKTLGLESLKRFKDDAKEVREGFECGMRITGFDDVKVGDVIEAFRIETRQRTL